MPYHIKDLCKIRTITTFIHLDKNKDLWAEEIKKANDFCIWLAAHFKKNGYQTQSIRIVTNAFGDYLNIENIDNAKHDLEYIRILLNNDDNDHLRIRFSIGEAKSREELHLLPELIKSYGDICNSCINIENDEYGILNNSKIIDAAKTIKELSAITLNGEGNFNFTVNVNCGPLIPYFPASYNDNSRKRKFVLGLETPDLLKVALTDIPETSHNTFLQTCFERLSHALQYHCDEIGNVLDKFTQSSDCEFVFSGLDSSAAPSKQCTSMVEIYKLLGVEYFGAAGTVEISSLLTKVFKSVKRIKLLGFSGLMLAVTEDNGLAQASNNNEFDIRALLTYSAVCGIGLDTVPIPGDTSIEKIAALIRDTGTMAFRLNKPLTVRLFPVPGLSAGDMTTFISDDLCNCRILAVP